MTGRLDVLLTAAALAGWLNVRCARDTAWVAPPEDPYYRRDLALVHHRGFGSHARACAPGILALLDPVRSRDELVLELGCGSGLLTAELTAAGHRVIATDASPAMLDLARSHAPAAEGIRPLVLPGDVLPAALVRSSAPPCALPAASSMSMSAPVPTAAWPR
jgi:SAM-dependent methyltransferase